MKRKILLLSLLFLSLCIMVTCKTYPQNTVTFNTPETQNPWISVVADSEPKASVSNKVPDDSVSVVKTVTPKENQTTAPTTEGGWVLTWEDNFEGKSLNQKFWNAVNEAPFCNNEIQTYRGENVSLSGGCLKINSSLDKGEYFSGEVTTQNKQLFQYGKIEIRAKFPTGKGYFPAIWLMTQSGDSFPELDILEYLGKTPDYFYNVMHYFNKSHKRYSAKVKSTGFFQDFHTITLEWSKKSLVWSMDGKETLSVKNNIPDSKMYIIINTAIGGNWPGNPDESTIFPQTTLVDYIRYYTWR